MDKPCHVPSSCIGCPPVTSAMETDTMNESDTPPCKQPHLADDNSIPSTVSPLPETPLPCPSMLSTCASRYSSPQWKPVFKPRSVVITTAINTTIASLTTKIEETLELKPARALDQAIDTPHSTLASFETEVESLSLRLIRLEEADLTHPDSRDTTPDLTLLKGPAKATWTDTHGTLTSDHTLIKIILHAANCKRSRRPYSLTDWTKFREDTDPYDSSPFADYHMWMRHIHHSTQLHSQKLQQPDDAPAVDAHLLHLWEARHSLIRSLVNPSQSKTAARASLHKLLDEYRTPDQLVQALCNKHITTLKQPAYSDYAGRKPDDNSLLEGITLAELKQTVAETRVNTAPGPDRITPQQLQNLTHQDYEHLLTLMNESWCSGLLLNERKAAMITFIPKPGKCTAHQWWAQQPAFPSVGTFRTTFPEEFLPPGHETRIHRELKHLTKHPDEGLMGYIRSMQ
ncbi:hypothetical protein HPB47_025240 [Ixodes persulcatus]|uniref:Uncharacterized protein n=1 Tax=Ixodes persulcatus TaxID=34615 RepID=A0AC60Q232_IXOPE|nr:hypothetical protein HPB47_025240 [Ixodes persulcatus]